MGRDKRDGKKTLKNIKKPTAKNCMCKIGYEGIILSFY